MTLRNRITILGCMVLVGGLCVGIWQNPVQAATPIAAAPVISRDVPAFTSDDCFTSKPASLADDNDYGSIWRSCQASPTTLAPVTLTYDLSAVPLAERSNIDVVWYNDSMTGAYDPSLISNNPYNIPGDYTLQANVAAGGGSPPASGWVTLATVTGNHYHSRQHQLNFAGYQWLRLSVTASYGSTLNQDVAVNMDVHNVANGATDTWTFFGDSITQAGFLHWTGYGDTVGKQINAYASSYFPVDESGGVGGFTAADGAANIATWLSVTPSHFVTINYGTNDANLGGSYLSSFKTNMKTMIDAALADGRVVIIPTIPWGRTANLQANVPTLNADIESLYAEYPQIIRGPDLYTYFNNNQSLINTSDDIHPTDPAGYTAYRTQWINTLEATIYTVPTLMASPVGATYSVAQSVSLSTTKNATIYYTLDGAAPTVGSTVYAGPLTISANTHLKAVAIDQAGNQSDVVDETYTITTSSSSGSGSSNNASNLTQSTQHTVPITTQSVPTVTVSDAVTAQPVVTVQSGDNLKVVMVTITDETGAPLPGISVTLHSTPQTATTDAQGVATFLNVAPGVHTLTINSSHYRGAQTLTVPGDATTSTVAATLIATVRNEPTPTTTHAASTGLPWLGVAILLIVAVVIALIMWRRKRRQLTGM